MMEKPELIYSRYHITAVAMAAAALMLMMLSFSGCFVAMRSMLPPCIRHFPSSTGLRKFIATPPATIPTCWFSQAVARLTSTKRTPRLPTCWSGRRLRRYVCTSTTHCRDRITRAACLSPCSSDSSTCRRDTCRSAMPVTTHPFLEAATMVATSLICFPMLPLG